MGRFSRFGSLAALACMLMGAWDATAATVPATVYVGNVGNANDTTGYGQVNYAYNIGKYEVTASQYTDFLNAVAKTDTYGLYNTYQSNTSNGSGISRTGTSGSYSYTVAADFVNRPVNYVSFGDAMRYANWLQNGMPTGAQGLSTTEDGAYFVNGANSNDALLAVSRKSNWQWAVTSENEWYKAAYYDRSLNGGAGGYWLYPTRSNTAPGNNMADPSGNNANYHTGSGSYPIDNGNFTTMVGAFQNSGSAYGTFDQGGNVWEWNEAVINGSSRGLRGGSFDGYYGYLPSYNRFTATATYESNSIGFRVSQAVPVPAGVWLGGVGLMLVGVMRWRMKVA